MGWHRIAELESEPFESGAFDAPAGLWTRGGCEGVRVSVGKQWLKIPREVLYEMVGQELIDKGISRLEQLTGAEMIAQLTQEAKT